MKKLLTFGSAVCMAATLLFTGCSEDETSLLSNANEKCEVSFNYTLSGIVKEEVVQDDQRSRSAKNICGTMVITDEISGIQTTEDWYVTVDKDLIQITSLMTQVLPPSTYSFELTIESNNERYVGRASNIHLNDADQRIIDLGVKPVIGDTKLNFSVVNLPQLRFQYKAEDLRTFIDPKIGYSIDGGNEQIVSLDAHGTADAYMNISAGTHSISLKLYDGNIQKGKSQLKQETVNVTINGDIIMDIIPLSAEVQVKIGVDGGAGNIVLAVPEEVIIEAGGVTNLRTVVQVTSSKNSATNPVSVTLVKSGSLYMGTATFPVLFYDRDVTITTTFTDISTGEIIGTTVFSPVIFDKDGSTYNGVINLIRRAVITGDILATIGVNVFDPTGSAMKGVKIFVNDQEVGITNSAWGTEGYLKFHTAKGEVTIKAVDPVTNAEADTVVVLSPLEVNNYILTVGNILDYYEFKWSSPPVLDGYTATGTINGIEYIYTSDSLAEQRFIQRPDSFDQKLNIPLAMTINNQYKTSNTLEFSTPITDPVIVFASIGQKGIVVNIEIGQPDFDVVFLNSTASVSGNIITGEEGYVAIKYNGTYDKLDFKYLDDEWSVNFLFGAAFPKK